ATAREVLQVQSLPTWDAKRWRREAALRETLRGRYHGVCAEVQELSDRVVQASSLVENLNSRLRSYFFLRRQLGKDYLTLLQFFLNHRRYLRSEDPSRVGKSPAELLTGEPHAHWLELLAGLLHHHRKSMNIKELRIRTWVNASDCPARSYAQSVAPGAVSSLLQATYVDQEKQRKSCPYKDLCLYC